MSSLVLDHEYMSADSHPRLASALEAVFFPNVAQWSQVLQTRMGLRALHD